METTPTSTPVAQSDPKTMPLADLAAQIDAQVSAEQEALNQPPVVAQAETPVAPTQVGQAQEVKPVEQVSSDGVKPQVETKPAGEVTFDELQKKAGFKSADDLAKSYRELQKTLTQKAQELAALRKPETPTQVEQPQTQSQPSYLKTPEDIYLEQRIQEVGTVRALKELNEMLNKPIFERTKDDELKATIQSFASSPDTADFYLPEVQSEIMKIVQERPRQFADNDGRIYPEAMKDLYYMAKGRIGFARVGSTQNQVTQKVAPVEMGTKNTNVQVTADPKKMPLQDLEALINNLTKE